MADADFLLLFIDRSRPLNQDDFKIISQSRGKYALVVMNKIDLPSGLKDGPVNEALSGLPVVKISALTGQGLDQLRKSIAACLLKGDKDMTFSHAAPNLRHRKALVDAAHFFSSAAHRIREDMPMEIFVVELKSGIDALGEIVGESTSEDVLKSIFSQFCLGK